MHLWVSRLRSHWPLLALVVSSVFCIQPAALAQITRSEEPVFIAPSLPPESAMETVLVEGTRLESLGRWGEAVTHYEEALRDHPGHELLERREDLAKLHFSLERRYVDRSYLQSLQSLSPQQCSSAATEDCACVIRYSDILIQILFGPCTVL